VRDRLETNNDQDTGKMGTGKKKINKLNETKHTTDIIYKVLS